MAEAYALRKTFLQDGSKSELQAGTGLVAHSTLGSASVCATGGATEGSIYPQGSVSAVNVAIYGAHTMEGASGTFVPIVDACGAAVVLSNLLSGNAYQLPSACFAFPFIKLVPATGSFSYTAWTRS